MIETINKEEWNNAFIECLFRANKNTLHTFMNEYGPFAFRFRHRDMDSTSAFVCRCQDQMDGGKALNEDEVQQVAHKIFSVFSMDRAGQMPYANALLYSKRYSPIAEVLAESLKQTHQLSFDELFSEYKAFGLVRAKQEKRISQENRVMAQLAINWLDLDNKDSQQHFPVTKPLTHILVAVMLYFAGYHSEALEKPEKAFHKAIYGPRPYRKKAVC